MWPRSVVVGRVAPELADPLGDRTAPVPQQASEAHDTVSSRCGRRLDLVLVSRAYSKGSIGVG